MKLIQSTRKNQDDLHYYIFMIDFFEKRYFSQCWTRNAVIFELIFVLYKEKNINNMRWNEYSCDSLFESNYLFSVLILRLIDLSICSLADFLEYFIFSYELLYGGAFNFHDNDNLLQASLLHSLFFHFNYCRVHKHYIWLITRSIISRIFQTLI